MRWNNIRWVLVALFGFCAWRAATNSITTDEAFTYTAFVAPSWVQILTSYDANHHVLHSLLCKLSTGLLGKGELPLRLPALLGTALYLWSAWRVGRQRLGETPAMAAAVLLMGVHAGLIDFLSLARGYSLGLGFLLFAMAESEEGRYRLASLGLGLAVASNPVFVVPAAGWVLALLVTKRLWRRADELLGAGVVAALVILAVPVSRASGGQFYYGSPTLAGAWQSLMEMPGWPWLTLCLVYTVPLAVLWGAWRERGVFTITLAFCLLSLGGLNLVAGFPWPQGRTGLYLLPLVILLAARGGRWSWAPLSAVAVVSLISLQPGLFREWRFDADNRAVAQALVELRPKGPVSVQFPLERGLRFYRPGEYEPLKPGAAVYVLRSDERAAWPAGVRVVRQFPRSGVVLGGAEK